MTVAPWYARGVEREDTEREEERPPNWDEEVARMYEEGYRKLPQTDEDIAAWESIEVWLDE